MSKPLYAPQVWRSLNGVLCVFKPPNTPLHRLSASIKNRILVGFANIPNYKYEYREALRRLELEASRNQQNISNDTTDSTAAGTNQGTALLQGNSSSELAQAMSNLELPVPPSEHRLVRGIRYVEPPKLWDIHPLADISSGVSLYFLGRDRFMYHDMITDAKYLRVYHVSGLLGRMTDDYTVNGRLVQRTSFSHITKPKLDKICVYTQQTHQKHMFEKVLETFLNKLLKQLLWLLRWYLPIMFLLSGLCKLLPWYIPDIFLEDKSYCQMIHTALHQRLGGMTPHLATIMALTGALELYGSGCVMIGMSKETILEGYLVFVILTVVALIFSAIRLHLFGFYQAVCTLILCCSCCVQVYRAKVNVDTLRKMLWADILRVLLFVHVLRFIYADLAPDSEEAYEVAKRGLIRPTSELSPPILYGVKCIQFDPPNFTLEIHSINETCAYLCNLVHDIGVHLKSSATTTKVKRIRYGIFNLDHTLVKYQMNLVSIQENIRMCNEMLTPDRLFTDSNLGNQKKSFNRNKETKSLEGKCSDLKADKFDKEENPDKETEKIIKTNSKHK